MQCLPPPQESRATYITLPAVVCIPNTRPPAAAKLKAGLMIRDEKGLCVEAACFKTAATRGFFPCYIFKNPERGVFSNFSQLVSPFSLPSSCFGFTISKCKQEERINMCACIHYSACCSLLPHSCRFHFSFSSILGWICSLCRCAGPRSQSCETHKEELREMWWGCFPSPEASHEGVFLFFFSPCNNDDSCVGSGLTDVLWKGEADI